MDKKKLLLIIAVIIAAAIAFWYFVLRARAKVVRTSPVTSSTSPTPTTTPTPTTSPTPTTTSPSAVFALNGNIGSGFFNYTGGLVLDPTSGTVAIHWNPNGGTYAILVQNGNVSTLPDNVPIQQGNDFSNIIGSNIINGMYAFGGGEMAYSPWSPCAAPCAPYVSFYSNGNLRIIKIPTGSCDNMNVTNILSYNNYYVVIGGANQGSATGGTGVVLLDSNFNFVGATTLAMTDSAGNPTNQYRVGQYPIVNDTLYIPSYGNGSGTVPLYLESIPMSTLINSALQNSGACSGGNVPQTYVKTLATDYNPNSQGAILLQDLSYVYWNGSAVLWKDSSGNIKMQVPVNPTNPPYPFFRVTPNGNLLVVSNENGVAKVYVNGNLVNTYNGMGFVDRRGYVAVFSGFNAGSTYTIAQVTT